MGGVRGVLRWRGASALSVMSERRRRPTDGVSVCEILNKNTQYGTGVLCVVLRGSAEKKALVCCSGAVTGWLAAAVQRCGYGAQMRFTLRPGGAQKSVSCSVQL